MRLILLLLLFVSGAAYAQQPVTFSFILRPDYNGRWYVQNDADHFAPALISPTVEHGPDFVRVFFATNFFRAGAIHVTSDDDFGPRITGHAGLGMGNATIKVFAAGQSIDPAKIWSYTPQVGGNFWVTVTMYASP